VVTEWRSYGDVVGILAGNRGFGWGIDYQLSKIPARKLGATYRRGPGGPPRHRPLRARCHAYGSRGGDPPSHPSPDALRTVQLPGCTGRDQPSPQPQPRPTADDRSRYPQSSNSRTWEPYRAGSARAAEPRVKSKMSNEIKGFREGPDFQPPLPPHNSNFFHHLTHRDYYGSVYPCSTMCIIG